MSEHIPTMMDCEAVLLRELRVGAEGGWGTVREGGGEGGVASVGSGRV